jgi:hypothetical protein
MKATSQQRSLVQIMHALQETHARVGRCICACHNINRAFMVW